LKKLSAISGLKLSHNQHGFRPQKSTKTALDEVAEWTNNNGKHVLGCFLDISGTFDNVMWLQLATDMITLGCKQKIVDMALSYLSNRTATYRNGNFQHTVKLTRKKKIRSSSSSSSDPLLKNMNLESTHIVAYADDIALLVAGNTRNQVVGLTELALETISTWDRVRGLTFSKEKSVMVPLKGGLIPGFTASFGDARIKSVDQTKYLGLSLQKNFYLDQHAINLTESSTDMFSRLRSIRKSKWGTSPELALMIYKAVYLPRITYGATIWFSRINEVEKVKKKIISAQRRALLAITGAYKTVSTYALQVIAGTLPIDLHIQTTVDVANGLSPDMAMERCLNDWQSRWTNSSKGRWTYSFMPDIRLRMVTQITFDHYTNQITTGHGDFNQKLHDFNLVENPACSCGYPSEDAKHILEDCPNAYHYRTRLRTTMEQIEISWPYENAKYYRHRISWEALTIFASSYLRHKEEERTTERAQQLLQH